MFFVSRKQLSSGQSFKKFEAVDVTAFNDDPEIEGNYKFIILLFISYEHRLVIL